MNKYKYIKAEIVKDIFIITLDRPKHNVMNISMIKEINNGIITASADKSLKALLFKSEGVSWCAGVEISDHKPEKVRGMIELFSDMLRLLHLIQIPTIASIQGACLGGGMELAIACDIVIASADSIFGQPEIKLGFLPPYAAIRLPKLIGPSKAIDLLVTGRRFKAIEAYNIGMISKLCDLKNKSLTEHTEDIVKEIRENSPFIIRLNKKAVVDNLELDFDKAFKKVNKLFLNDLMNSNDVLEGIKSFEERRHPIWLNK